MDCEVHSDPAWYPDGTLTFASSNQCGGENTINRFGQLYSTGDLITEGFNPNWQR